VWVRTPEGFERDGIVVGPPLNEDALAYAYLAMKRGGQLDQVFSQSSADLRFFLDWLLNPKTVLIGAWKRPMPDVVQIVGMGFVNHEHEIPGLKKAEVGFAFLPEPKLSIFTKTDIVKRFIDYTFERTEIESMFGLTPDRNPGAVRLIERTGMRLFGPIPKYCGWHGEACGAWVSQVDKEYWKNSGHALPD
jgi:RimJ/RimL family protein N-acetyltransferase